MEQRFTEPLTGEVHIDGAYVNHSIRPKNKKSDRIDRRLAEHQREDKRCVLVMRQGTEKTKTFVIKSENQASVMTLAQAHIDVSATICADESNAYDTLHAKFPLRRVNHSMEYRADDGTHNNYAESYFSRFRRMQLGQCHKFSNRYLDNYANEAAYREDMRKAANGDQFDDVGYKCLHTKTSRDWCGYWQGNKRWGERLAA